MDIRKATGQMANKLGNTSIGKAVGKATQALGRTWVVRKLSTAKRALYKELFGKVSAQNKQQAATKSSPIRNPSTKPADNSQRADILNLILTILLGSP